MRCSARWAMRLLDLLVPLVVGLTGCGLGSTVVGEGPPTSETEDAEDDARIERTLAAMSSSGPLFACTFDGGGWPGASEGTSLTVARVGASLYVGNEALRFDRVDKSGPPYPTYRFMNGDQELVVLEGGGAGRPMWALRRSTNGRFDCRERLSGANGAGVFDDAQLDALVTVTNGRR
jgi:hypothetical protein